VLVLDKCPVTGSPPGPEKPFIAVAPILVALAPIVANFVVSGVKNYIQQAKDDLTANYVAAGSELLFDTDGKLQKHCLVIVRGIFGKLDDEKTQPASLGSLEIAGVNKKTGLILSKETGLADYPDLYLEIWLNQQTQIKNKKIEPIPFTLVLEPQLLHFAQTAAKRSDSSEKFIGIVLAFSETALDEKGGKDAAKTAASATVPFDFRAVEQGKEYTTDPNADANALKNPLYDQRRAISFAKDGGKGPVSLLNLYAFVTETENASPYYQLIIDSIAAKGSGLEEAITNVLTDAVNKSKEQTKTGGGS